MGRQGQDSSATLPGTRMQRSQSRLSLSASFEALAVYFPCMNSFEVGDGGKKPRWLCAALRTLRMVFCSFQIKIRDIAWDLWVFFCAVIEQMKWRMSLCDFCCVVKERETEFDLDGRCPNATRIGKPRCTDAVRLVLFYVGIYAFGRCFYPKAI